MKSLKSKIVQTQRFEEKQLTVFDFWCSSNSICLVCYMDTEFKGRFPICESCQGFYESNICKFYMESYKSSCSENNKSRKEGCVISQGILGCLNCRINKTRTVIGHVLKVKSGFCKI